jgi:hypothetical protein
MRTRHINPEGFDRGPAYSQAVVVEQPAKAIYLRGSSSPDSHFNAPPHDAADGTPALRVLE